MVTGCGSAPNTSPLSGGGSGGPSGPTSGFFLGRVLLEDFVGNAEVNITDLNGNLLYQLKTNNAGLFHAEGELPKDFTVTATRPGDNMVVRREVRGGYDGLTMYINPLSTLTSLYMQDHGADLATAQRAVADYFFLPRGYSFDWVTNAQASPFSPSRFYQLAQQNGGNRAFYLSTAAKIGSQPGTIVLAEVASSTAQDLVKTIAGDVLGDTVSLVDAGIFGAITQALGLNLGTTGALKAISEQLDQVLEDISQIEQTLSLNNVNATYNADRNAINPDLNNIKDTNSTIVDTVNGLNSVSSLTTTITSLVITNNVANISDYLLGRNNVDNIIFTYAQVQSATMGISATDYGKFQGYPVRFNSLTSKLQQQLKSYLETLALAANLYAEIAHVQIPIAPGLRNAAQQLDGLSATAIQAGAQVPGQFSSDQVLCDLENGLMWYSSFLPQSNYYTAQNTAKNFQEGGFTDWRLASRSEMENFIQSRIGATVTDQDSDSQWESAFDLFGFNLTNYGQQTFTGTVFRNNTDKQGQSFYDFSTNSGVQSGDTYQWQGVSSNPATATYGSESTSDNQSTFILVRTYAGTSEAEGVGNPFAYGQLGSSELTMTATGNQLKAEAALDAKGVTTPLLDVTSRCFWTSSNNSMATVSSFIGNDLETGSLTNIPANPPGTYAGPGPIGSVTWHPPLDGSAPTSVTFTGTFWAGAKGGSSGNAPLGLSSIDGTITLNPPTGLVAVPTSNQILPYNQLVDLSTTPSTGVSMMFYATTFYQDGQLFAPAVDGTGDIVFTLLDSQNNVINGQAQGGGFITQAPNELILYPALAAGNYTVRATYKNPAGNTMTGTAPLRINNIVAQ